MSSAVSRKRLSTTELNQMRKRARGESDAVVDPANPFEPPLYEDASQDGVIKLRDRNPVSAPQGLIVVKARMLPHERQLRANQTRGDRSRLCAPPAATDSAFDVSKPMVGWLAPLDGLRAGSIRQGASGESPLRFIGNMAGLSKDATLFMPCVAQNHKSVSSGDTGLTCVVRGIQTLNNTGDYDIGPGDRVFLDPNSARAVIDGEERPVYERHGLTYAQFYLPKTQSMRCTNAFQMIKSYQEELLGVMRDAFWRSKLVASRSSSEFQSLLRQTVEELTRTSHLSVHQPVYGMLQIWVPWFLMRVLAIDGVCQPDGTPLSVELRATFRFWCAKALYEALQRVYEDFREQVHQYDMGLPHDLFQVARFDSPEAIGVDGGLHSRRLADSLSEAHLAKLKSVDRFRTVDYAYARLDLIYDKFSRALQADIMNWFARHTLGIALDASRKGDRLPILVGQ